MKAEGSADVVVIGAGLSGLTCSFLLHRMGFDVLLLEKSNRFGGAIRSIRKNGFLIEAGPNSTLETTPLLTQLIRDVGIEEKKLYANDASKKRFILRDGVLHALPMSPTSFLTTALFSTGAKLRLLREPFIPSASPKVAESVADFVRRRLGSEFLDYAINPFVAGVYAGDPDNLELRSAFPKLHELEQKYGSLIWGQIKGARERKQRNEESKQSARMFSFIDGMQTLTDALAACLPRAVHGVDVSEIALPRSDDTAHRFSISTYRDGERYHYTSRTLVIATPAKTAASLSRSFAPDLDRVLGEIPYPPVAEVITAFRPVPTMHALDGFGFLIPSMEKRRILGTIFSSTLFRERAPDGMCLLTTFLGGMRQPEEAMHDEENIVRNTLRELHDLLGTPVTPEFSHVTTWPNAIPQYVRGHLDRMFRVESLENQLRGLFYCANYRDGISVGDCVKSANAVASRIASVLSS